jgi:hypothetical protein
MHRYRRAEADGLDRGRDAQPSVGRRYQKGNDPCDRQKHQNQYCFHFFTRESIKPMILSQPSGKGLPSSRNTCKRYSKSFVCLDRSMLLLEFRPSIWANNAA